MSALGPVLGALLLAACTLSACTSWPPIGGGGMAETRPPARPVSRAVLGPGDPTWEELATQSRLAQCRLDALVLRGAELCLPGQVAEARDRQTRITRQLYGGLPLDAANDLIIQRERLAVLQRSLDYIQGNGACMTPAVAALSVGADR
ncbi:MAG TPA: hypothetical protein VES73_09855 [Lamprocystis sp. (in: g-proteobacteria)]|nr:hypothetical protein [Lamprocystis sp. (in: g-proteobacteria)]